MCPALSDFRATFQRQGLNDAPISVKGQAASMSWVLSQWR
jgi:hypothetical protein